MPMSLRRLLSNALLVFLVWHFLREEEFLAALLFLVFVHLVRGNARDSERERREYAEGAALTENPPLEGLLCEEGSSTPQFKTPKDGMTHVVVLDDDEDDTPTPEVQLLSTPSTLTQEQRTRIAQQKELALARRMAKEKLRIREGFGAPSLPSVSQSALNGMCGRNYGDAEVEQRSSGDYGAEQNGAAGSSVMWGGKVKSRGFKREIENSDENTDRTESGWVSIRKRPTPGHSFGRGFLSPEERSEVSGRGTAGPLQSVTGAYGVDSESEEKRNGSKEERSSGQPPESSSGQPPKLDWQKPQVPIKLSKQQVQVLSAIVNRKSVFLTGSAGTGKSFVMSFAIRLLKRMYGADGIYVTASTGLAACALGGTTVHSFAGVGLGQGSKETLVDKVKSRRDTRNRWLLAKALIVDEISMIDGEFFDKLDYVGRMVRNSPRPFGGIQLIVTGDFYQLPPVNPENPRKYFAFEADCWDDCFDMQVELQHVFRQSDEEFVGMLNEIRRGGCSPENCDRLLNCSAPVNDASGIVLTRLYPRKMDVARENEQNLRALNQSTVPFIAKDEARSDFALKQLDNVRVERVIHLAIGAQVMLAKNLETSIGLVNGARGVVVGFAGPDDPRVGELTSAQRSVNVNGLWPLVRFACEQFDRLVAPESWTILDGDVEVAKRTQVPLILAWALSVHKCQGMTLDRVETDLSRAFDYGMVYVALSRVKSLEGLRLRGFDPTKIRIHPKVRHFYENLAPTAGDPPKEIVDQKGLCMGWNDNLTRKF